MKQHDESPNTDIAKTPGEADEEDGGYMVDNLLLKVLKRRYVTYTEIYCYTFALQVCC